MITAVTQTKSHLSTHGYIFFLILDIYIIGHIPHIFHNKAFTVVNPSIGLVRTEE